MHSKFLWRRSNHFENLSKFEKKQFLTTLKILKRYKKKKRILFGGTFSKKKLKISPTILKIKLDETEILEKELLAHFFQ